MHIENSTHEIFLKLYKLIKNCLSQYKRILVDSADWEVPLFSLVHPLILGGGCRFKPLSTSHLDSSQITAEHHYFFLPADFCVKNSLSLLGSLLIIVTRFSNSSFVKLP